MATMPSQLNRSPTFVSSLSPLGSSSQLHSPSLPQSVEALIAKICRDQHIDPPDEAALLRLHRLGEEAAMDILRKIERSTVRKSFSALLMYLIKQHESQNARGGCCCAVCCFSS